MQGQSEVPQPAPESVHHALRIVLVLEADDEVVGIAGAHSQKPAHERKPYTSWV